MIIIVLRKYGDKVNKIRIKNLRSLKDTQEIDMKQVNILVGSNSSGKSTFLRLFPLLKQSFNKRINGPILWAGDVDDYVDFGSFKDALNNNAYEKEIAFSFEMDVNFKPEFIFVNNRIGNITNVKTDISIKHIKNSGYDYISNLKISIRNYIIEVVFNEEKEILKVIINGCEKNLDGFPENNIAFYFGEKLVFDISLYSVMNYAREKIKKYISIIDENKDVDDYFELSELISYIYEEQILKQKKKFKNINEKNFYKLLSIELNNLMNQNNENLLDYIMLYKLPYFYNGISNYLYNYFNNVYYIAPIRATAERYYGLRNVAVNEVDCKGKNLAIFLNSLSPKQFASFQQWTKENLGFCVEKIPSEGHVSIKIRKSDQKQSINLSDTGFGYSQILPIITQLWYIAVNNGVENGLRFENETIPITIAIEQPELHLHPALQAKLVDIIIKVAETANKNNKKVKFIIETHSETMINRFGHLVYRNKIDKDSIGIIIFNKEFGDDNTQIQFGCYDEEGYLKNWPVGFFEPEGVFD
jgi:predicted ATPase